MKKLKEPMTLQLSFVKDLRLEPSSPQDHRLRFHFLRSCDDDGIFRRRLDSPDRPLYLAFSAAYYPTNCYLPCFHRQLLS